MHIDPTKKNTRQGLTPFIGLLFALVITTAIYWSGLSGSYLFDDYPNIVDNKDLQINAVSISSLARAALSSPSSEFRRPLASLSFAANYLMTGLDPFWMKFTNLLIHLLNGVLIYALALALIRAAQNRTTSVNAQDPRWPALLIAAGWMLLPINLTSVLYVVQRMESLANLFVLLGLLGYVSARQRMLKDGSGYLFAISSLVASTAIGLMSKETAVMTPLYAALIEWALFRAHGINARRDYRIIGLFVILLLVPLMVGLIWLLPRLLIPDGWATRNFDLSQRLLTETRVVIDYIQWTLLPTPQALSFYHDDYLVSTGWLKPWTTLVCTLILVAISAMTVWLRKRAPLVALGFALFLGAQLLTGTILPLELVYEHRNYFASFGLLLALLPVLASTAAHLPAPAARYALLGGLLSLWPIVTLSNAFAWGSPLTLAQTLAGRAPDSPRALYDLGHAYIVASRYDPKSPFTTAAYTPLEKAMRLPNASILPEHALIIMRARMHQPIDPAWWDSIAVKFNTRKIGVQDETALDTLTRCAYDQLCDLDQNQMVRIFLAALSKPNPSARLIAIYGAYAWNTLHDRELGKSMLQDAVRSAPNVPPYRIALVKMLIILGRKDGAALEIRQLEQLNTGGRLDPDLKMLRAWLLQSDASAQPTKI